MKHLSNGSHPAESIVSFFGTMLREKSRTCAMLRRRFIWCIVAGAFLCQNTGVIPAAAAES